MSYPKHLEILLQFRVTPSVCYMWTEHEKNFDWSVILIIIYKKENKSYRWHMTTIYNNVLNNIDRSIHSKDPLIKYYKRLI